MGLDKPRTAVISLNVAQLAAFCTAGSSFGAELSAIVVVEKKDLEQAKLCSAQKVYFIEKDPEILFDDYFASIYKVLIDEGFHYVLLDSSRRSRAIAARLAAKLNTSLIPDVSRMWLEEGQVFAEHMVFGGSALRIERCASPTNVAVVADEMLSEQEPEGICENIVEASFVEPKHRSHIVGKKLRETEQVNLARAKKVVSIGRGLAEQEDLKLIEEFASSIGAELGCTRPVAEGSGWMPKERYIGVSGAKLNADVFVAIGLSGQVQHMVGASNSKSVYAINKDKSAAIFKQADYGIVGDLYKVLPKLTKALELS